MKKWLKIAAVLGLAWIGIQAYFWTQKTDLAYCVITQKPEDFTGEWMKHAQAESELVVKTLECQQQDVAIDGNDGNKAGRVRWVACLAGPDCNEGGNF